MDDSFNNDLAELENDFGDDEELQQQEVMENNEDEDQFGFTAKEDISAVCSLVHIIHFPAIASSQCEELCLCKYETFITGFYLCRFHKGMNSLFLDNSSRESRRSARRPTPPTSAMLSSMLWSIQKGDANL